MGAYGEIWSLGRYTTRQLAASSTILLLYTLSFYGLFVLAGVFEVNANASIWFPPAGFRLAVLLILGWRFGGLLFCAEALHALFIGAADAWGATSAGGTINLSRLVAVAVAVAIPPFCYTLAAFFLERRKWPNAGADPFLGILRFLLIASVAAAANGIFIWLNLRIHGLVSGPDFHSIAGGIAIGDLIGILTLTPMLLFVANRFIEPRFAFSSSGTSMGWAGRPLFANAEISPRRTWSEAVAVCALAAAAILVAGGNLTQSGQASAAHWYPFLIPVIWLGLRYGLPAAIVGTFSMNTAAALLAAYLSNIDTFQDVQIFMVTLSVTGLLMGTVVSELRKEKATLDLRVRGRTLDLMSEIDRRQRAEEAALQEKQRAESYLSIAQPAIVAIDRETRITLVNNSAMRLLGRQRAELLGRDWVEVLGVETDRTRLRSIHRALIAEEYADMPTFETRVRGSDGDTRVIDWRSALIRGNDGSVHGILCSGDDITERVAAEEKLRYLASHDPVTGLNNRSWLLEHFPGAMARARRQASLLAVLFIDLSGFKQINDGYGHACGDTTLAATAKRLTKCVRESDAVTRMGGDEFVVLLEDAGDAEAVARIAEKILRAIAEPLHFEGGAVAVSASIGIALFPDDGETADELLSKADAAMYLAKRDQAHGYRFTSGVGFLPGVAAGAAVALIGPKVLPIRGGMAE